MLARMEERCQLSVNMERLKWETDLAYPMTLAAMYPVSIVGRCTMDDAEYKDFWAYCKQRWSGFKPDRITLDVYMEWRADADAQVNKFARKAKKALKEG